MQRPTDREFLSTPPSAEAELCFFLQTECGALTERTIPVRAFVERLFAAKNGVVLPRGGKHILLACMPKSGSTFLARALSRIPELYNVALSFGYGHREQELCLIACSMMHDINYVAQHHVRYSSATQRIMTSFQVFPVILTRNVFDSVVSFRDHLEYESLEWPIAYLPPHILQLPKDKQYDVIIDLCVPWYANFLGCWSRYKGRCLRISYRDIVNDPNDVVARILMEAGLETPRDQVDRAIAEAMQLEVRYNVGREGRGKTELSYRQIDRIRELFTHYPDVQGVQDILSIDG